MMSRDRGAFKLDVGDLPQDLSVQRSSGGALNLLNPSLNAALLNHTPAHSGNGVHLHRSSSSAAPVRTPWPKDEIQVHRSCSIISRKLLKIFFFLIKNFFFIKFFF